LKVAVTPGVLGEGVALRVTLNCTAFESVQILLVLHVTYLVPQVVIEIVALAAHGLPEVVAMEAVLVAPRLNVTVKVPIDAASTDPVVLNGRVIVIVFVVEDVLGVTVTFGVPRVRPAPTMPDLLTCGVPVRVLLPPKVTVC
jgi:hypothetical protein